MSAVHAQILGRSDCPTCLAQQRPPRAEVDVPYPFPTAYRNLAHEAVKTASKLRQLS